MLNIIHCILDEKFINGVMEVFDHTQGEHRNSYVLFPEGKREKTFRYLKYGDRVEVVRRTDALQYVTSRPCDVLIMHNLSAFPIEQLARVPDNIRIVWLAWGYDLYSPFKGHRPFIPINMYRPLTRKAINHDVQWRLKRMAKRMRWRLMGYGKMTERGVGRIDYFSGVIPWEYDMMTRNPFFRAERTEFTYCDMNPFATEEALSSPAVAGRNILLGNSGGETNNHIDIMEQLRDTGIVDRKIIVPLSYGGRKDYTKQVIAAGNRLFGDRFKPLNTFIPLAEYQDIMASCGYAVYAIERQQALGNVWLALWNGLTVFMTETSPLYSHLVSQGYKLFTTQRDLHLIAEGYTLTEQDVMHNRQTMLLHNSLEKNLSRIYKLYDTLENDIHKQTV